MSLSRRMAEYGFETNSDYSLPVRMLLERPSATLRVLNITGESGRRKTAFANALALALEWPHLLYHDFGQQQAAAVVSDEDGHEHPPIKPFDRVMSEACALSEGEKTVVILDQLHLTAFAEHLRLYEFVKSREWHYLDSTALAHSGNLLLMLISEEPVYHSLQKLSLRVWVDSAGSGRPDYQPADFGRSPRIGETMDALADLFEALGVVPTPSEYEKILYDLEHFVRTPDALVQSIYGWTEGVERARFRTPAVIDQLAQVIETLYRFLGVESLDHEPGEAS